MNYSAIIKKIKNVRKIKEALQNELQTIEDNGIFKKKELLLHKAEITISTGETVLNFVQ
jgi:glycine C-acetyltransferase